MDPPPAVDEECRLRGERSANCATVPRQVRGKEYVGARKEVEGHLMTYVVVAMQKRSETAVACAVESVDEAKEVVWEAHER